MSETVEASLDAYAIYIRVPGRILILSFLEPPFAPASCILLTVALALF